MEPIKIEDVKVYHFTEPAPIKYNVKLIISTKGVHTWEITVLNASTPEDAVELAVKMDHDLTCKYPNEDMLKG